MSTSREHAAPHTDGPAPRGAESAIRPASAVPSVGALVSRRSSSGFGAEPRSF